VVSNLGGLQRSSAQFMKKKPTQNQQA